MPPKELPIKIGRSLCLRLGSGSSCLSITLIHSNALAACRQLHIETLRVIAIYELEWRIRQRRADTEVAGNDDIKVHEASCIEGGTRSSKMAADVFPKNSSRGLRGLAYGVTAVPSRNTIAIQTLRDVK